MEPQELPVRKYATTIADAVRANDVVVVIGETGSGKTTQIAQILLDSGSGGAGVIGVTQPRRVGAVTVARRVAEERGVSLGEEVGYAVRFEDRSSSKTRVKFLTDGTLLREVLEDATLGHYSALVLDEAHERGLNTDILFGVLKTLVATRNAPGSRCAAAEASSSYGNNGAMAAVLLHCRRRTATEEPGVTAVFIIKQSYEMSPFPPNASPLLAACSRWPLPRRYHRLPAPMASDSPWLHSRPVFFPFYASPQPAAAQADPTDSHDSRFTHSPPLLLYLSPQPAAAQGGHHLGHAGGRQVLGLLWRLPCVQRAGPLLPCGHCPRGRGLHEGLRGGGAGYCAADSLQPAAGRHSGVSDRTAGVARLN